MSATLVVTGQRSFGAAAAAALTAAGHRVSAVIAPAGRPDPLAAWAAAQRIRHVPAEALQAEAVPRCDAIIAAHSHAFLGRRTRARADVAVGYHPSLLPLHRGRDAVRWTIRDRDRVTGGSVYHLTDHVDGGPLAAQAHTLVPPGSTAATLWRDLLFPLGLRLLVAVADDIAAGRVSYVPQDERCATWEPSWARSPIHRPELLELGAGSGRVTLDAELARLRG